MRWIKSKAFAFVAASLATSAILGGSLGIAAAGQRASLGVGFNLIGGPLQGDVTPAKYVSCLPAGSWSAVYIWDGANQRWLHFFNTGAPQNVPAYVNDPSVGGIVTIKAFAGVAIIMNTAVASPFVPEQATSNCPPT